MNPEISIIIPLYNVECYLSQCIESVLAQTYINFELILIDDGSSDKSLDICHLYASKDKRIKVIHTTNQGVSSARNTGLDYATGDWITFIDADDWVGAEYLETLIAAVDRDDMLIVQGIHYEHNDKTANTLLNLGNQTVPATSYKTLFAVLKLQQCAYAVSKLYNRAIVTTNNIRFDHDIHAREDMIFMLHYLLHVVLVKFISHSNYHYRIDTGGLHAQIMSFASENKLSKSLSSLINQMDKLQTANYDFKELRHTAASCLMTSIFVHYRPGHTIARKERLAILDKLTTADLDLIRQYYILPRRALYFPLYLIKHKKYKTFDTFLLLLFNIGFFN